MEAFDLLRGKNPDLSDAAATFVVDLAQALQRVQLNVVWPWARYFDLPQRILRVLCGCFAHARRVLFENEVTDPMITVTAVLPGSEWSVLLSGKVWVYVDDINLRFREVAMDLVLRSKDFE